MLKQYAKITNGELERAPINMFIGGKLICNINRRPDLLAELGYKPLTIEGAPEGEDDEERFFDRGEDILLTYISGKGGE